MGYRIVKDRRAWWPVEWRGADEDGAIVDNRIELRFRLLKVDQAYPVAEEVDNLRLKEGEGAVGLPPLYAALVAKIAVDWRGVEAENGDPLPFTEANLQLLMNEPFLFTAVFEAWRACLGARESVREGN